MSIAQRILEKFGRKTPVLEEVAAVRTRLASNAFRMSAYSPDDLITQKGFSIYDEMQNDSQVRSCLNTKKFAILSKGWDVQPASNSPEDIEIAAFVKFCFEDMRGSVQDVLFNMLDAIAKGFSICEMNYKLISDGPFAGMVGLESIKSKDPAYFGFDMDEYLNVRQLTMAAPGVQADLPREKFAIYTYMPAYEMPYGQSDLRAAYKHWFSKEIILRFWNMYLEKFGMPTAKGSYTRGMPRDQQDELLRVLDKIQQETAIVVPADVTIELLEAQRGGEAGYQSAIEYHNRQIAKAILGQTLSSDTGSGSGSYAMAKVHLDVLYFYLQKVKRDLEESVIREQVIRPLVDFNFSGGRYPRFTLGRLEEGNLELLGGLIEKLINGKVVAPDEPWIREYLGLPS